MDRTARLAAKEMLWSELNSDVLELVFSKLPDKSICEAAATCKRWHSVANDLFERDAGREYTPKIAFFRFSGVKYSFSYKCGSYVFQPVEDSVPMVPCPEDDEVPSVEAAGGLLYAFTGFKKNVVHYKLGLLENKWRATAEIPHRMQDPIAGAVRMRGLHSHKLVFAGGETYNMGDGESDDLIVSIYDGQTDSWEKCDPLPDDFSGSTSSLCLGSLVHRGKFYVYDRNSGCMSRLDLESRQWSEARNVHPPVMVNEIFMVSLCNRLYVVGVVDGDKKNLRFEVWRVDVDGLDFGVLLHSTTARNACTVRPSTVMCLTARSLEPLARCVGVVLIVVLFLIRLSNRMTGKVVRRASELCH